MTVVYAAVLVALSLLRVVGWLYPVMVAAGVAWIWLMLSFNVSTQSAVPEWMRVRGMSIYLLMFMAGMAVGSTFWGLVAAQAGMAFAFLCSGAGKADEFAHAMQELGRVRRRDGAAFWGLYRDLSDPRRHVETFIVETWAA